MNRDLRVDAVRGVALVSMFVAHTGPGGTFEPLFFQTNYLTATLFAMLVGVGATLAWQHRRSVADVAVGALIRGAVLLVLAPILSGWGSQVVIILGFLGVLTWCTALLPALPSRVLAVVAVVLAVFSTWGLHRWASVGEPETVTGHVRDYLVGGSYYRVSELAVWAILGILLTRWWLLGRRLPVRVVLATVVVGTLAVAAAFLAHKKVPFAMDPYDGSIQTTAYNAVLAVVVVGAVLLLVRLVPEPVWHPLAFAGALTLTAYVLQVAWLAYDVRVLHPGTNDNTWTNLAVLTLGALVLATAWRLLVRSPMLRRGPLEAVTDSLVLLARRALPHRR